MISSVSTNKVTRAPLLAATDLVVRYGRVTALRGVSVKVYPGEAVCVVGPNGAGKSTLLLSIAGAVRAHEGQVRFGDDLITGRSPDQIARSGLALIREGRHIFSTLSVRENLLLGYTARSGRRSAGTDIGEVLELFPILKERLNSGAGKLSGGEQQQLAIARALLAKPRFILIDEPSLGLGPLIVDQVYATLSRLQEQGLTLLVVEESTARVADFADRVYVMRNGVVAYTAEQAELARDRSLEQAYFGFDESVAE